MTRKKTPTKLKLLALVVHLSLPAKPHQTLKKSSGKLVEAIRENGWADLVCWAEGMRAPAQTNNKAIWQNWFSDQLLLGPPSPKEKAVSKNYGTELTQDSEVHSCRVPSFLGQLRQSHDRYVDDMRVRGCRT